MGESTCLIHPLSYAPALPNEAKQDSPMVAIGESISFGRYMPESLDWEKWSIFSHKRYVEEAERYTRPGSVAQKKAFFEAHYKRKATMKAEAEAAMLEQANSVDSPLTPEPRVLPKHNGCLPSHSQTVVLNRTDFADEGSKLADDLVISGDVCNSDAKTVVKNSTIDKSSQEVQNVQVKDGNLGEADAATKHEALLERPTVGEDKLLVVENQDLVSTENLIGISLTSQIIIKQIFTPGHDDAAAASSAVDRKRPVPSSFKSSELNNAASNVPPPPTKPLPSTHPKKENNVARKSAMDSPTDQMISIPRKSLRLLVTSDPISVPEKLTIPAIRKTYDNQMQMNMATPSRSGSRSNSKSSPAALRKEDRIVKKKQTYDNQMQMNMATPSRSGSRSNSKSSPAALRKEDRIVKKKQEHGENSSIKDSHKVKLHSKTKAKRQGGLKRFFHCFCFKAESGDDFSRKTGLGK